MDPSFATATELSEAIASWQISSRELTDHLLSRIERLDPPLNAVVALDADRARARADEADAASAEGRSWGPLHGVPMTVKDVWETEGLVTTSGAPELAQYVPTADAVPVARLKDAGAIVMGKTNSPLMAGDLQTFNDVYGVTSNPWDTARSPGGSSGGAAAAVAAGLTPIELGSDIGGSIRNPAHFCGIYGLKPSWNVVPDRGHIPGPPGTLVLTDVNCAGPLARSVQDLRLVLDVIAGPLPEVATAWQLALPPSRPRDGVIGLRVGYVDDDTDFPVGADVRHAMEAFAGRLGDAGAEVTGVAMPVSLAEAFDSWIGLVTPIIGAGLPEHTYAALRPFADAPADDALGHMAAAIVSSYRRRVHADQRRQLERRRWAAHFERYDVMVTPVMPLAAALHDQRPMHERTYDIDGTVLPGAYFMAWCCAIGAMLLPVVTLPVGFTPSGLPVGVQVVGPSYQDHDLLAIAAQIDRVAGEFAHPPGFD
jgi:amidase